MYKDYIEKIMANDLVQGVATELVATLIIVLLIIFNKKIIKFYKFVFNKYIKISEFTPRNTCLKRPSHSYSSESLKINIPVDEYPSSFGLITPPEDIYLESRFIKSRLKNTTEKKKKNSKLYFNDYLCDFSYTMFSPYLSEDRTEVGHQHGIKASKIVDELLIPALSDASPQIINIIGKIGCGKSTLVGAIISELQIRNIKANDAIQFFPIIINARKEFQETIDNILGTDNFNEGEIHKKLSIKLLELTKEFIINKLDPKYTQDIKNSTEVADVIDDLIKKHFHPIFFIDELDTIYSLFCKYTFCELNNKNIHEYEMKYRAIIKYFVDYQTDTIGRGTFTNSVFFIISRISSDRLFCEILRRSSNLSSRRVYGAIRHSIELDDYRSEMVSQVFIKRTTLKKNHVKDNYRNIENSADIVEVLNTVCNKLQEGINYDENLKISIHGLRHLMILLGKAEIMDPSCKLLSSFILNPGLLKTFQYLDGDPEYSLMREGVSNIFLVNRDYITSNAEIEEGNNKSKNILDDHLYNFSLKYLLFSYIIHKDKPGSSDKVYLNDVLNKFGASKEFPLRYEKSIIKLVLFHSTEVQHGRLMKLAWDGDKADFFIKPSARARAMIDDDLFWEFGYLMVISEDKWLEFPPSLSNIFNISHEWQLSYHFFINFHNLSLNEKIKFIKYKIKIVLSLCSIIKISFKYERGRYKSIFDYYEREISTAEIDLDIEKKILSVKNSIMKFSTKYIGKNGLEAIQNEIDKFNCLLLEKEMKDFYKKYHGDNVIQKLESKMKKYYDISINHTTNV